MYVQSRTKKTKQRRKIVMKRTNESSVLLLRKPGKKFTSSVTKKYMKRTKSCLKLTQRKKISTKRHSLFTFCSETTIDYVN